MMNPFQVMSEPIRRRIIELLSSGSHTATEIGDVVMAEFSVTRRAATWHLRILLENEWIDVRLDGPIRHYFLDGTGLNLLRAQVRDLEELWERRIGWLADYDPQPEHALPVVRSMLLRPPRPPRPPRLPSGEAKGLRGRDRRDDLWAPPGLFD
ncbi:winged helix-turn-helix domain-containing protein [Galbitalea sp. SE-J8]|uniref:ArsR/SmtB family transcription factor n=1 Tax=Galbitalea sp. SE-J8 TaxID=3054952 RepID=UPI00259CE7DE|nr:winged helix-turn-helix domain-containing protein [Galbitalea sp. SE-J8]MDM4762104.1 winged helix-turn-helix domain-containing protein [Galbitalea sp. SE-J8]